MKNPFEISHGLKKTSAVEEFTAQYERFPKVLKGTNEEYLVGIYLIGSEENIRAEVKLFEPSSLAELMAKTQMVEDKNSATSHSEFVSGSRREIIFRLLQKPDLFLWILFRKIKRMFKAK